MMPASKTHPNLIPMTSALCPAGSQGIGHGVKTQAPV